MNKHLIALISVSVLMLGCGGGSEEPASRRFEETNNGIATVESGVGVVPNITRAETQSH